MTKEMVGKQFGQLLVLERAGVDKFGKATWLCQCSCGKTKIVCGNSLRSGLTKSCGCLQIKRAKEANTKHEMSNTKIYDAWNHAKERCYNPNCSNYKNYGGRGITMCNEWKNNPESFIEWSFENGFDNNLNGFECSLDRIDVNGNYEPNNCRWVGKLIQANNTRTNHYIEYNGERKTVAEWARILGINYQTLLRRINNGWEIEKAFTTNVK